MGPMSIGLRSMSSSAMVAGGDFELYRGDVLDLLPGFGTGSVDACVTSPPYLDARPEYGTLTDRDWPEFFEELRRVVAGPALVNVGRLWADGVELSWWIDLLAAAKGGGWAHLDTLIWHKPNANPIRGKVFADSHEYVLILGRPGETLNVDAVRTPYAPASAARMARRWVNGRGTKGDTRGDQNGRTLNAGGARARSVISVYVGREKGNPHPAPMPLELAEDLVLLASQPGQTVLDPFAGSGTTALAARRHGRLAIAFELKPEYADLCAERNSQISMHEDLS